MVKSLPSVSACHVDASSSSPRVSTRTIHAPGSFPSHSSATWAAIASSSVALVCALTSPPLFGSGWGISIMLFYPRVTSFSCGSGVGFCLATAVFPACPAPDLMPDAGACPCQLDWPAASSASCTGGPIVGCGDHSTPPLMALAIRVSRCTLNENAKRIFMPLPLSTSRRGRFSIHLSRRRTHADGHTFHILR